MNDRSSQIITGPEHPALLLDTGNTSTVVGYAERGSLQFTFRIPTHAAHEEAAGGRAADGTPEASAGSHARASLYAALIREGLVAHGVHPETIRSAAITSVVPAVTVLLTEALRRLCGVAPLIVTCRTDLGLTLDVDRPETVGTDLLVGAHAATRLYGAPVIVIDMGTATTFAAVDGACHYLGHCILPGIGISLRAMLDRTAQLPEISLTAPRQVIGKNTTDAMNSGILHGNAALIDGMIDRIERECGTPMTAVATGGLADLVIPLCRRRIIYDEQLLLKGLLSVLGPAADRAR